MNLCMRTYDGRPCTRLAAHSGWCEISLDGVPVHINAPQSSDVKFEVHEDGYYIAVKSPTPGNVYIWGLK